LVLAGLDFSPLIAHHIDMSVRSLTKKFLRKADKTLFGNGILSKEVKFDISKSVEKFFRETKENMHSIKFSLNIPLAYELFVVDGYSNIDGIDMFLDSMILGSEVLRYEKDIPSKPTLEITFVFDTLKVSAYTLFEVLENYKGVFDIDYSDFEKFAHIKYKVEDFELPFLNGNYL
jgi:hypothetical protein